MGDHSGGGYRDGGTSVRVSRGEGFTPEEGLELLRTFQSIPRRADRNAALEIVKRIATQARIAEDDTVLARKPRVI